ncbi:hypothetical protein C5S29_08850 [ANME-1 cluster archaeon GoMg3.2]|nr:hypothetical protein [ANME-1 cluster archaeon GoMg3.2]
MGFAFDPDGRLFVGNRERGEVFGLINLYSGQILPVGHFYLAIFR